MICTIFTLFFFCFMKINFLTNNFKNMAIFLNYIFLLVTQIKHENWNKLVSDKSNSLIVVNMINVVSEGKNL